MMESPPILSNTIRIISNIPINFAFSPLLFQSIFRESYLVNKATTSLESNKFAFPSFHYLYFHHRIVCIPKRKITQLYNAYPLCLFKMCSVAGVPIFVEHWGDDLQFYPNFALFSALERMNLDYDFFQVSKISEDQKKDLHQNWESFFSEFKCCSPTSSDSDAEQG